MIKRIKDMKLEIKHLAPYLPYALKMQCKRHFIIYGEVHILPLNGISKNIDWQLELIKPNDDLAFIDINEKGFKPILRPLSDTVPYFYKLFIDGELGEYIDSEFLEKHSIYEIEELENIKVESLPYGTFQLLVKHHFDVFDLIENGLAIDINTLNK